MKISERKQRLRARGWVPAPQEPAPTSAKKTAIATRAGDKALPARKGATQPARPASRPRWQPSAGYQITFGIAYIVFSPILFWQALAQAQAHAHPLKGHPVAPDPGIFGFGMPVVFFLFGLWWVYRGLKARRQKAQGIAAITTSSTPSTSESRKSRRGVVTDKQIGAR